MMKELQKKKMQTANLFLKAKSQIQDSAKSQVERDQTETGYWSRIAGQKQGWILNRK